MKANNLSVCIANKGCDKDCPYCVSKMTGASSHNVELWERNVGKVLKIADIAKVTSVSLTGKGEPMLNIEHVYRACEIFRDYPIELQTNGIRLSREFSLVNELYVHGVDTIAISIDTVEDLFNYEALYNIVKKNSMTVRVVVNMTNLMKDPRFGHRWTLDNYLNACTRLGIEQITFRQVTKAEFTPISSAHNWIDANVDKRQYTSIVEEIDDFTRKKRPPVRYLPYGAVVHDIMGISVTSFEHCIQDSSHDDGIRSLIWDEDGHVYTAWNSKASRLF